MEPDSTLRALLARTAEREKGAFRQLYRTLYPPLLRFLYRTTGSLQDAEDMVNEVMLVVWRNAGNFRGESQVSTWVFGIAHRISIRLRQQMHSRDKLHMELTHANDLEPPLDNGPLDHWLEHRSLTEGLTQLPKDQRDTVELAYWFGYSCEEIATLMQCPAGTVKTRLYHARQKLQHYFVVMH